MRRRTYLSGVTALGAGLAGCGGGAGTTDDDPADDDTGGPSGEGTDDGTTDDDPADDDSRSGPPQVAFAFDYAATGDGDGELTVTHSSGEHVRAASLVLRGDFEGVASGGTWLDYDGSASGDVDGDSAVVAGDSVTVPVPSEYEMRVIWETGDDSAILATA